MGLIRCENGHLFSEKRYGTICPYCSTAVNIARKKGEDVDGVLRDTTYLEELEVMHPVVGWLVCIEGPEKGVDYRIAAKNNSIGRGETADICIKGDPAISRENHARLSYDGKHNNFYLIPAESTNNVYINDEPVFIPTQINSGDIIELGESKFMFIPFCNDRFNWQEGLKQDG